MSTTVLLLTVDRTAGCTDRLAVVLNLDVAGRISAEQRFHRTDTPLACFPDGTPPTGWWNAVTMPATVNTVHTGDLKLGTGMVAIWNGTPALDRLTRWAFDRFAAAGLSLPPVKRITILAADADACDGILGYAVGPAVTLCLDVKVACIDSGCSKWQPWAKATLLHELAHLWLGSNAKPATKSAFLKRTGLATWDGGSVPAGARGGEAAAQTIAWGLTDEPYSTISGSKVPACAEIGVRFLMLTGMAPISPRC